MIHARPLPAMTLYGLKYLQHTAIRSRIGQSSEWLFKPSHASTWLPLHFTEEQGGIVDTVHFACFTCSGILRSDIERQSERARRLDPPTLIEMSLRCRRKSSVMKGYLAGNGHPVPGFQQMTYLSTYAPPAYQVPT